MIISKRVTREPGLAPPPTRRGRRHPARSVVAEEPVNDREVIRPGLDTLERRFQALRDQIGAMPEACRPELEGALQELSQAIAALRADREAGESPRPDPPAAGRPKPAKRVKATRLWTRQRT